MVLSQNCPTVPATLSVHTPAGHIVIKQESVALEIMEVYHALTMDQCDFLVEIIKMKEF